MTGTPATPAIGVITKLDGVVIEYVTKLPAPEGDIGEIPTTNQDSGWGEESMPGRYKAGKTMIEGIYVTGKTGINKLRACQNDRLIHQFQVIWPNGTICAYDGFLGTFQIIDSGEKAVYQIPVKVLGIPAYSDTASALTTPFFATNNSGVITPAPSATGGEYVITYLTGVTSATITPTNTSSGAVIYVNGAIVATGVASGAITLGAAGSITDVTMRVTEPAKSDVNYILKLVRASA